MTDNFEITLKVDRQQLVKHYLKHFPHRKEWEVPDTQEIITSILGKFEHMGISQAYEVRPEREIIGRTSCCMSPIYK